MVHFTLNKTCYGNLIFKSVEHRFETRGRSQLALPVVHTEFLKKDIAFSGPFEYNRLPTDFKTISNRNKFKKKLKEYLINEQV